MCGTPHALARSGKLPWEVPWRTSVIRRLNGGVTVADDAAPFTSGLSGKLSASFTSA
jgi:hypothetical protein